MLKKAPLLVCLSLYPFLIHGSILWGLPSLQVLAVLLFLTGVFWPFLWHNLSKVHAIYAGITAIVLLMGYWNLTLFLLYIPPVLIPLTLLIYFGKTLLPNREPLITDIGEKARGPLSAAMRLYTRRLTLFWCVTFFVMSVEALILSASGNKELWSYVTNFINYILISVLFVGEFWWRKYRFPDHNHPGFFEYLQIIAHSFARK